MEKFEKEQQCLNRCVNEFKTCNWCKRNCICECCREIWRGLKGGDTTGTTIGELIVSNILILLKWCFLNISGALGICGICLFTIIFFVFYFVECNEEAQFNRKWQTLKFFKFSESERKNFRKFFLISIMKNFLHLEGFVQIVLVLF